MATRPRFFNENCTFTEVNMNYKDIKHQGFVSTFVKYFFVPGLGMIIAFFLIDQVITMSANAIFAFQPEKWETDQFYHYVNETILPGAELIGLLFIIAASCIYGGGVHGGLSRVSYAPRNLKFSSYVAVFALVAAIAGFVLPFCIQHTAMSMRHGYSFVDAILDPTAGMKVTYAALLVLLLVGSAVLYMMPDCERNDIQTCGAILGVDRSTWRRWVGKLALSVVAMAGIVLLTLLGNQIVF